MQLILDVPVGVNVLSGVLAVSVLTYLLGHRPVRGLRSLRLLMAALAWWAFLSAAELAIPNTAIRVFLSKVSYVGITFSSPAWVLFTLSYRDKLDRIPRWLRLVVFGSVVFMLVSVFTNDWHRLVWTSTLPDPAAGGRVVYRHGLLFYLYAVMAYAMIAFGSVVLIRASLFDKSLHRRQSFLLVTASLFPLLGNIAYLLRLLPWSGLDPTPVLFIFSGLLISTAIRKYRMFDLLPVARDRLFDVMQDVVVVLDRDGRVADLNRAAKQWLTPGLVERQWLGMSPADVLPLLKPVAPVFATLQENREVTAPGQIIPLENGQWVDVRHAPIQDRSGQVEGHIFALRDVTLRKQAELQLLREKQLVEQQRVVAEEQRELADAANQAKSVFLTNMSHEMRTPLMAMTGYQALLEEMALGPEPLRYVREIGMASHALLDLVNEMLDLSRIEAGHLVLERIPFRLDTLLEECASLVSVRLLNKPVDLTMEQKLDNPLVVADRGRVRQMILNLLGNAAKFTESGAIHLSLRTAMDRERSNAGGQPGPESASVWVALEVSDTGPGIAEEVQPRLFEPFVQANAEVSRKYGGSGLGLAITARIADAMGGRIHLESWPGLGSTFVLVLPLPVVDVPGPQGEILTGHRFLVRQGQRIHAGSDVVERVGREDPDRADARRSEAGQAVEEAAQAVGEAIPGESPVPLQESLRALPDTTEPRVVGSEDVAGADDASRDTVFIHKHILIAEDTEATLRLITHLLERIGCRVSAARTGLEAVDLFGVDRPDLVLMDIQMPAMDGLEATRFIRSLESGTEQTPIIAMTANAMEGERQACLEAGMDDFLSKPVQFNVLKERIRHWLTR